MYDKISPGSSAIKLGKGIERLGLYGLNETPRSLCPGANDYAETFSAVLTRSRTRLPRYEWGCGNAIAGYWQASQKGIHSKNNSTGKQTVANAFSVKANPRPRWQLDRGSRFGNFRIDYPTKKKKFGTILPEIQSPWGVVWWEQHRKTLRSIFWRNGFTCLVSSYSQVYIRLYLLLFDIIHMYCSLAKIASWPLFKERDVNKL
jgi:hypothetical protein